MRIFSIPVAVAGIAFALVLGGCQDDDTPATTEPINTGFVQDTLNGEPVIKLSAGTFSAGDYRMTADSVYLLSGLVKFAEGATLTIEPGTIIKGDPTNDRSALIMLRGSRLIANGTPENPIVFTSGFPAGQRGYGDWGGVVLCGKAPINQPGNLAEYEGLPGVEYGGDNPDDTSGSLSYIRIEYAGVPIVTNQEINGLTMAGVGRGTTIDHIQVSYSGDDSFEWFGGTVNCSHLVAYRGFDDDFDTDFGYTGNVQYAVSIRDPKLANGSGASGFESSNHPSSSAFEPFTNCTFSNVTLVGPLSSPTLLSTDSIQSGAYSSNHKGGLLLQDRTRLNFYNSVILGWPHSVWINSPTTTPFYQDGTANVKSNVLAGTGKGHGETNDFGFDIFGYLAANNDTLATVEEAGLTDPFNLQAPNLLPAGASPALAGASFSEAPLQDSFFEATTFRGAFGSTDWTADWTNWDPQNTPY